MNQVIDTTFVQTYAEYNPFLNLAVNLYEIVIMTFKEIISIAFWAK